jgi:hypothetical protein
MMSTIRLDEVLTRAPFPTGPLASGSTFEQGVLPEEGGVVLKHLPANGGWLTRFSGGDGRARLLWESGVLDAVAAHADHAVIGMGREHGHDVVVMRDVGADLLPARTELDATSMDDLLRGLAQIHDAWEGRPPPGLCAPGPRHRLASPALHRDDTGPHPCPFSTALLRGWERFAELAPDDVATAVFAVLEDVEAFGRQLVGGGGPRAPMHDRSTARGSPA